MECIETRRNDLPLVANCHMATFKDSLSSKLGRSYCIRMLSWYIESDRGVLFHIKEKNEVLGYCGGIIITSQGNHGSATSMIQHSFRLLVLNLIIRPWLIFHHEIRANIPLIIKNIKLRLFSSTDRVKVPLQSKTKEFIPSMGLVVIGVSSDHQGKGYGSLLLKEFESRARKEGLGRIHLSVHKDNQQAITAYKRNGWVVGKESPLELNMFKDLD